MHSLATYFVFLLNPGTLVVTSPYPTYLFLIRTRRDMLKIYTKEGVEKEADAK
jgi:hypothetical protein